MEETMRRAEAADAETRLRTAEAPGPLFAEKPADLFADSEAEPSGIERRVAGIVHRAQGRHSPVKLKAICAETGLDEREAKDVIRRLRRNHRMPIGSRRGQDAGCFWIVDADDEAIAAAPIESQIVDMAITLRAMTSKRRRARLLGQVEMALVGETEEVQAG